MHGVRFNYLITLETRSQVDIYGPTSISFIVGRLKNAVITRHMLFCRWHISPRRLPTIVSTAFILQSMGFYLLISELEKLAQLVQNSMLAHPQRAKYIITRSIMKQLWTPSILIMLTIVHINLIHMLCRRLQIILLDYMTSHLSPMQYIMIVSAVR